MDLIDRYLDAVRLLLPSAQRDDIAAELRDVLTTQREEKEAELGRRLKRSEEEALLHDFGHPLMVAARYGRPRHLIGPELYPVYAFVMRIVVAAVALAAVITGVIAAAVHGDGWRGLGQAIGVIFSGGFASFGAVTLVFAALERSAAGRRAVVDWRVGDLPRLSNRLRNRESWQKRVAGFVLLTFFILWWVGLIPTPTTLPLDQAGASLRLAFDPALQGLYFAVLALAAGGMAIDAVWLASRETRRIALGLELILHAGTALVAGLALNVGHWAVVAGSLPAAKLAEVAHGVNIGAEVTLIVIIVVAVGRFALTLWRLFRRGPNGHLAVGGA